MKVDGTFCLSLQVLALSILVILSVVAIAGRYGYGQAFPASVAIGCHLLAVSRSDKLIAVWHPQSPNYRALAQLLAMVLPVALLPCLLMFYFLQQHRPTGDLLADYEAHIRMNQASHTLPKTDDAEVQVEPLVDIIDSGSKELGRDAIAKLGRMETAQAVKVLRTTLNHRILELRLYAFYEIDRLEKKLAKDLSDALNYAAKCSQLPEAWQRLADSYYRHCRLGLLDSATSRHYLDLALDSCRKALELAPGQNSLLFFYATIWMEVGDFVQAQEFFCRGFALGPAPPDCHYRYADCLLRMGKLAETRQELLKVQQSAPELLETISSWWLL